MNKQINYKIKTMNLYRTSNLLQPLKRSIAADAF